MEEMRLNELRRLTKECILYRYQQRFSTNYRHVAHALFGHQTADKQIANINREVKVSQLF